MRCHAFINRTKGPKTYIKSIFKEFDRLMDCLFRFIDAHTDTKYKFTHPYHGRSHGFISSNFSSFPHENETWERTQLCCFVLLLFHDNSIELTLVLATYVEHNAPLPLGLARWESQGETLLLTVFCGKCTPSQTSVVGCELEPWNLPSAPRYIYIF